MEHWHTPISRTGDAGNTGNALRAQAGGMLLAATLLARTAGVPHATLRRVNPDGSVQMVRVSRHLREVWASAPKPQPKQPVPQRKEDVTRLVWLPQGFVLTPRSADAPDGRGLPVRDDGSYTPGGAMRQVLLNTFADNQYPEAVYRAGNPQFAMPRLECAPLFFMDWELPRLPRGIGMVTAGGGWRAQFDAKRIEKWQEASSGKWHCHRPQPAPESAFANAVRIATNAIRKDVGQPPLGAALRGQVGTLAGAIVYEMVQSGVQGHDSRAFSKGYETTAYRFMRRDNYLYGGGENLARTSAGTAGAFVTAWKNSPPHYASMIKDWAKQGQNYAWVDAEKAVAPRLHSVQLPPYGNPDGPVELLSPEQANRPVASQIFRASSDWLVAFNVGRPTEPHDRVGVPHWVASGMFLSLALDYDDNASYVTYRGRLIAVLEAKEMESGSTVRVIGAGIRRVGDDPPLLRVVLVRMYDFMPTGNRLSRVEIHEGRLNDFLGTRQKVAQKSLPHEADMVSAARVSRTGQVVFSVRLLEFHLHSSERGNGAELSPLGSGGMSWPSLPRGADRERFIVGGAMRHYHWSDLAARWLDMGADDALEITTDVQHEIPPGDNVDSSVYVVEQKCEGEMRLLCDFGGKDEDQVDFLIQRVKASATTDYVNRSNYGVQLKGTLVFPDGTEFVYQDVNIDRYSVSGFVTYLMHLDVRRPENLIYLRLDLSGADAPQMDAEVFVRGRSIARREGVLKMTAAQSSPVVYGLTSFRKHYFEKLWPPAKLRGKWIWHRYLGGGGPTSSFLSDSHPPLLRAWYLIGSLAYHKSGDSAQANNTVCYYPFSYPAEYSSPPLYTSLPPHFSLKPRRMAPFTTLSRQRIAKFLEDDAIAQNVQHRNFDMLGVRFALLYMGGSVFSGGANGLNPTASIEFAEGEWLAALHLGDILPPVGNQWWPKDERYRMASSLDIERIVGEKIIDNIFPFGVC